MHEGYLVFAGLNIPNGGMDDFQGCVRSVEMALDDIEDSEKDLDWCHIVEKDTLFIVTRGHKHTEVDDEGKAEISWEWIDEE